MFGHGVVSNSSLVWDPCDHIDVQMVKRRCLAGSSVITSCIHSLPSDILGQQADIHTGGVDLKFPHHDNEIAQAEVREFTS